MILGAGREKKDDKIDMAAGIVLRKKTGERVNKGDALATLYTSCEARADSAEKLYLMQLK